MNTTSVLKMQRELVAVTEERDRLAAELAKLRAAPAVPDAKTAGIIKRLRDACPAGSGCKCMVNDAASELERLSALLQSAEVNHD